MAKRTLNSLCGSALTVLLLGAAALPAVAQDNRTPSPVTWTNGKNVEISGSTVMEACNGCGDAGAESRETLASGDGYFDFTVGAKDIFAVGIGSGAFSTNVDSIEHALRFNGAGSVEVRESGKYVTDNRYKEGDRFRIAIEGGAVNYYMYGGSENNWVLMHSNPRPADLQYPIKIEAALLGPKTSVTQAVAKSLGRSGPTVSAITNSQQPRPATGITWTNVNNATANGSTLVGGAENAGAISAETLNGDGWVEFTAVETDKMRAIGFDHENSSHTLQDIDYGIVLREAAAPGQNPVAEVWEKGAYVSDTPYGAGDRFRIAIEGGKVKYYKYVNNQLVEIPAKNSTVSNFPVHLDAALYGAQSTIADVTGTRQN